MTDSSVPTGATSQLQTSQLYRLTSVHKFVYDPEQIRRFARLINSNKGAHQIFLSARPKYQSSEEKSQGKQIQNKHISPKMVVNMSEDELVRVVQSYERPIGAYLDRNLAVIRTEMLVIYMTTNFRDTRKAGKKLAGELLEAAFDNPEYFDNLNARLTSCVMSSKGKTDLITIDIDSKEEYPEVRQFLREKGIVHIVVETRGGYHVMFHPDEHASDVFMKFNGKHSMGDIFCPIPGTYQGGFPVRFVDD